MHRLSLQFCQEAEEENDFRLMRQAEIGTEACGAVWWLACTTPEQNMGLELCEEATPSCFHS